MTSLKRIAALIVAAGSGSRAGEGIPKQYRCVNGKPMLRHSVEAFSQNLDIDEIFIVIGAGQSEHAKAALNGLEVEALVEGGATRRESVYNGLCRIAETQLYSKVLIHDAARPFLSNRIIDDLVLALEKYTGAVPALPIVDSLAESLDGSTLSGSADRSKIWRIQTPQAFDLDAIWSAHHNWDPALEATDDARMLMAVGGKVARVPGDEALAKYTFAADFEGDFVSEASHSAAMIIPRTGMGYDVHCLEPGEELWLCGLKIDHDKGLSGHSDADVALHALTDAVLGAAALGDIGDHFPPSDPQWRGASSDQFLAHAAKLARDAGYSIANVDLTIICEAPKIGPHRHAMRARVAEILAVPLDAVSIKATTTEKLGFTGREEGIAAQAIATLYRNESALV